MFGQTCDGADTISQSEELPDLEIEDLVYSENARLQQCLRHVVQRFPAGKSGHINTSEGLICPR